MSPFALFLKNFKELGIEYFHRYYSEYPGQVTDVNDPEKRGRVKLTVPSIMGAKILGAWADPADCRMAAKGKGEFFPPDVGDFVIVHFEFGDLRFPSYRGGYFAQNELPQDFLTNYPNVRGWVFKAGHKLLFDSTPGSEKIVLLHKSGANVMFNADGSGAVSTPKGFNVTAGH